MTMLGMNPANVELLAEELEKHAEAITNAASESGAALEALEWVGDDATEFRSQFSTLVQKGTDAAESIRALGLRASGEASQQRTTSLT